MHRLLLLLVLIGCTGVQGPGSTTRPRNDNDAAAYQACDTLCVRPSDCLYTYNDDGICPTGFVCAFRFECVSDGGTRD